MKYFFVLIVIVLVGCGDDRGSRNVGAECNKEEQLKITEVWADDSNEHARFTVSNSFEVLRAHLCYIGSQVEHVEEWCWWTIGTFNDERCEYPGECTVIPSEDVDRLRAERCN